ncbi:GDSL-type esterase/lipase family protein [Caproiciproducens sp. CPB-2]|uniref:GDSL-type esterase/lipase family protein n=1 Tax=Caproiciproducens sp. CPB-2 TaxID=3030017 RepID=UPI0023DB7250|nr:GDSL-type esterase/lipase family protein [Caproiciproducens sp. CPB-2]MDF1494339.1 GDSL-type esterase/lipase family protein [Caproiciproducens sp. CPB-2]
MAICIFLAGVLYLIGLGAFAAFRGISQMVHGAARPQSSVPETVSSAPPDGGPSKAEPAAGLPPEVISSPAVPLSSTPRDAVAPAGYFDDALLIGDSRTEALRNYDGLDNAAYYAVKGLMVSTIFTKPSIEIRGKKLPVMQALKEKKYGKVYIMLGVNELGWSSFNTFIQDYQKVIDGIKTSQPGAVIYVQSILPVTAKKSGADKVYNNRKIEAYNQAIEEMAAKSKVRYLAVNTAVSDSEGNLPEDASADGVHLNREYCRKWCEYLRAHTNGERD